MDADRASRAAEVLLVGGDKTYRMGGGSPALFVDM
jgi:hypothetical protein